MSRLTTSIEPGSLVELVRAVTLQDGSLVAPGAPWRVIRFILVAGHPLVELGRLDEGGRPIGFPFLVDLADIRAAL